MIELTLKECCKFQEGYVNPSQTKREYFGGPIKWLRASDLNDSFVHNTEKTLSIKGFKSAGKSAYLFQENSIAISKSGTIGRLGILKDKMCGNRAVINIHVNSNIADLKYIFYTLKYKKKELLLKAEGSIQKNLYVSALETITLNHRSIIDQIKIASVLSTIDSKIELNSGINAELEAKAKTIYDYWFVQFDFPDKNGKPYKTSGGKMVWNEELRREIPEGWEVQNIETCCAIVDCLHSKKSNLIFEDDQSYLLQLENILDNGLIDLSRKYYVTRAEYKKWTSRIEVQDGDIVITNAGRVAANAQIPHYVKAGIGRNITAIRPLSINATFLFLSFQGYDIKRQIKLNTDSGAFFTSFNVKGIKKLSFLRAVKDIEDNFEKIVLPLRRQRELNIRAQQELRELRDFLLPMLMNGQVRVGN
jgi:type I restriction enzyme S subunit